MSVGRAGPFVQQRAVLHRQRWLPVTGEVLLEIGDRVSSETVVARTRGRGLLHTLNAARILDILPAEVPGAMLHAVGASVTAGEPLARTRGLWGLLASVCRAPVTGTVAAVSAHTGRILLEEPGPVLEVRAFLPGIVTGLVPQRGATVAGWAARIAGVFGVGGERSGPLRAAVGRPEAVLDAANLDRDHAGAVVIGGSLVTGDALRRAADLGIAGVICGGVHDRDLEAFLGQEIVLADTTNIDAPLTLVITGGFGRVTMAREIFDLLQAHLGRQAGLVGHTRVRAGAERPEVIIPLDEHPDLAGRMPPAPSLATGSRVLVVRAPWFGQAGQIGRLPAEPRLIESGALCLVAEVDLDSGQTVVVPRANLEILSDPPREVPS